MKIVMKKAFAVNSVGIIGGSDGPTAVFVSTKPALWILVFAAVSALGLLFCFLRKRKR